MNAYDLEGLRDTIIVTFRYHYYFWSLKHVNAYLLIYALRDNALVCMVYR